jgi:hypothetical protein
LNRGQQAFCLLAFLFALRAPAAAGALFLLLDVPSINVGNIRKSTSVFKKI